MTFGFIAKGDTGALLASSESANYEFAQRVTSGSSSGNVTTYSFSAVDFPMFFIEVPVGGKAGILDFTNTTVRIIADGVYPVNVFKRVSNASGFGIAVYDAAGSLTFKANANILNVKATGSMGIGGGFGGAGSMVSFPALASVTNSSTAQETIYYQSYGWTTVDTVYVCRDVFQCNYVTTYDFSCGMDATGNFSCGYVANSNFVCGTVTTCGYEQILTQHFTDVYAVVRITYWNLQRAVAKRTTPSNYAQDWVQHTSGYYKEVIGWNYFTSSMTWNAPPNYQPPPTFNGSGAPDYGAVGYYTKANTFPYSNGQTKSISATILTA